MHKAYRINIRWSIKTTARSINLHVRNNKTGKFRVVGNIVVKGQTNTTRTDSVDFIVDGDGYDQIMLGAVHFTGVDAGANIQNISIEALGRAAVKKNNISNAPSEKAKELSEKDSSRFVSAYAQNMRSRNTGNAHALMMFHSHGLEKGLSHDDFRPGFGKIAIPNLAVEMNKWLTDGHSPNDIFFKISASVMRSYFERHKSLNVDVSHFRKLFEPRVWEAIANTNDEYGGVVNANSVREAKVKTNQDKQFLDVVYGRRSVREFTTETVADDDIVKAVKVATQAPSVCNRQPARVHQIDDPKQIRSLLQHQGGFRGYKAPPKLLLITSDLSAFVFSVERNQAFIDGGLFMMSLLLGLEYVGLGACCLNTAMNTEQDAAVRKILNLPDNEVLISFIAIGHYDPDLLVARSKRLSVDEVLVKQVNWYDLCLICKFWPGDFFKG